MFLPSFGNVIIPTDELIFFQRGRYTTNQIKLMNIGIELEFEASISYIPRNEMMR